MLRPLTNVFNVKNMEIFRIIYIQLCKLEQFKPFALRAADANAVHIVRLQCFFAIFSAMILIYLFEASFAFGKMCFVKIVSIQL